MANDMKRMWTKEDINKNSVKLKDIGIELLYDSSVEISKEQYDYLLGSMFIIGTNDLTYYSLASHKWANIDFDDGLLEIIRIIDDGNGKYVFDHVSGQIVTSYLYEELVRATPTDVSIIEDQGKLELMLEHDGNVLAINDTPNQFLQRRLDKPSAEWDGDTSPTDLQTWLEEKLSTMHVGQVVAFRDIGGNYTNIYCLCTYVGDVLTLVPLGVFSGIDSLVTNIYVDISEQQFTISEYGENDKFFDFVDLQNFKLF